MSMMRSRTLIFPQRCLARILENSGENREERRGKRSTELAQVAAVARAEWKVGLLDVTLHAIQALDVELVVLLHVVLLVQYKSLVARLVRRRDALERFGCRLQRKHGRGM